MTITLLQGKIPALAQNLTQKLRKSLLNATKTRFLMFKKKKGKTPQFAIQNFFS